MNIDKSNKFMAFLHKFKTEDTIDLIESIQQGYVAIVENSMDSLIKKMQSKVAQDRKAVAKPDPAKYITDDQLKGFEKYLDRLFERVGIDIGFSKHFLERVNDVRNRKQITLDELKEIFDDTYTKYGIDLSHHDDLEAVITDLETYVNIPFALTYDPRINMLKLTAKTVMRKPDFMTSNPKYYV